jgi:hypothetical protein
MCQGRSRRDKNPRVPLDEGQKVLFIFIGKVFSRQQVKIFIIGMIEVSRIAGNEQRYDQEEKAKTPSPIHWRPFLTVNQKTAGK